MKNKTTEKRSDIRRHLRAARRALTPEQQKQAAVNLAQTLMAQPLLATSQNIAVYIAHDGEIDPGYLVKMLWKLNKNCYLPLLSKRQRHHLEFMVYEPDSIMVNNRFGIPEPEYAADLLIEPENLDVVLMPLTGFDEKGGRLGMGGGYYDRTFEFIRAAEKPLLVGLAHECQKVPEIPAEHWDIPMAGIATNNHYYQVY